MSLARELNLAKNWRELLGLGIKNSPKHNLIRWFYGPGESLKYSSYSVDQLGSVYWITDWGSGNLKTEQWIDAIREVFTVDCQGIVYQLRPKEGSVELPSKIWGIVDDQKYIAYECGVPYWIQSIGVRHPGVFLDHAPLRRWLSQSCQNLKVLNTFAYTGSLSIAAAIGGAQEIVTVDLSKATIEWAKKNNELLEKSHTQMTWISDDVFEVFKKYIKQGRKFDMIILDPPSFSRTKSGTFSTKKDLKRLHQCAMSCVEGSGFIITSINSEGVSQKFYKDQILEAALLTQKRVQILTEIHSEMTFVKSLKTEDHLKGYILKIDNILEHKSTR